ncbi:MAG: geranylgeranylglycerol-phosphate geranylgeranyltransferase [Candidatus Methanoplasma sp.]|nr:geranylgeranylglycerol-phosphate geranylgeranyltransferase [Candidatus Methanoplasma sp.]
MNRYLRLFRLGNGVIGILGVIVGALAAAGLGAADRWADVAVGCAVVVAFIAGGNSLNDYIDREIDKAGHPDRPLPMGEISPRAALRLGIAGLAAASLASLLISLEVFGLTVMAAAMMVSYELFLKQRGFVGNVAIALLTGMVFLFGGAVVGDMFGNAALAVMAALANAGREVAKDIEDMGSDEGRRTLPMAIGEGRARAVGAALFLAGVAASAWPVAAGAFGWGYCVVIVADAMFIYAAFIIFREAKTAQKHAKLAMMAALVAFVAGVIQWP